jgi:LSD1 subclass zinc finger protein
VISMLDVYTPTHGTTGDVKCQGCGAVIHYTPGTTVLTCGFCGATREVVAASAESVSQALQENSFEDFIKRQEKNTAVFTSAVVTCAACGACVTLKAHTVSDVCVFCATPLHVERPETCELLTPAALLPFKWDEKKATGAFKNWLESLWFAPGSLKKAVSQRLQGVYIPYWTYDAHAETDYMGERGDDYQVQERYTAVENGQTVSRVRTVTRTRWHQVSGHVQNTFDDVLVAASRSLKQEQVQALEPWDLPSLVPYHVDYLTGFRAEVYQIDVQEGLKKAQQRMGETIRVTVERDIGGDHQKIHALDTQWSGVTFKHILLPLWVSAYVFDGKVYKFLVNSRTGEVSGERPWSAWKIAGAVAGFVGAALTVWWMLSSY